MSRAGVQAVFEIRDGSEVLVRPIKAADKHLLVEGFEHLSARSRYQRFLVPTDHLSRPMLRYLTEVDHHDHEALIAQEPETEAAVGVARWVRLKADPTRAEAAVTVADEWQGRGLGTLLLELMAGRARSEGVTHFRALVLAENRGMVDLLVRLGRLRVVERSHGAVEFEAELPEQGVGPGLSGLLRAAAEHAASGSPTAPARRD